MTREFLVGLNMEEGLVDKIMTEYGKSVQKYKDAAETDAETVKSLKKQLKTANEKIAEFGDMDISQIQREASEWKEKAETADKNARAEIETLKKTMAVKLALGDKAYDPELAAGLFDMDAVKLNDDGTVTGVKEQLEALQKSKAFLFKTGQVLTNYEPKNGDPAEINPWTKEHFNLTEQGKIYKEDPARAKAMMAAAGNEMKKG